MASLRSVGCVSRWSRQVRFTLCRRFGVAERCRGHRRQPAHPAVPPDCSVQPAPAAHAWPEVAPPAAAASRRWIAPQELERSCGAAGYRRAPVARRPGLGNGQFQLPQFLPRQRRLGRLAIVGSADGSETHQGLSRGRPFPIGADRQARPGFPDPTAARPRVDSRSKLRSAGPKSPNCSRARCGCPAHSKASSSQCSRKT